MKILHVGLVGPANENMSYQGAIIPKENNKAGHDVTVIWSCYKWDKDRIVKVPEEDIIKDGIRYIRISYDKIITEVITEKVRKSSKLLPYLEEIKPEIIFNHDLQTYELMTIAKYIKNNPKVKFYADSHSDINNSANNWFSLNLLHKIFYKTIINKSIKFINKILYISYENRDFLKDVYKIEENMLEFYPLGGTIVNLEDKLKFRHEKRAKLGITDKCILFCHSGKMDYKKRTFELIENFIKVKDSEFRLIIIGTFTKDIEDIVIPLINKDNRILYLGWKNSYELIQYIAASDLYLQPGSQSATMQNALCTGTPVLFQNVKSHEAYMVGNAFAIDNYTEMESIFIKISKEPIILKEMSKNAYKIAYNLLDYKKLAERITR